MVPGVSALLAGAVDSSVPGALPIHLLLLPRRLLQGVLGGSAVLCGWRTPKDLLGRAVVPVDPPERPSLLHVYRGALSGHVVVRRLEGHVVAGSGNRNGKVWHRSR